MSLLFISYRRDDVGAFTHELGDALSRSLGESKVFLDLDRIRIGSQWQQRITDALARATLLILVIGPRWLHLQDIHGRRRLDNPDDWVRMEIQWAIRRGIPILPMLVDGTSIPVVEALPQELQPLTGYHAYSFSTQYFKRDFPDFLKQLGDFGFRSHTAADVLPAALDRSLPLTEVDLREALKALPNWQLVDSRPLPEGTGAKIELFRHYIFSSFADAMHFMAAASRYVDKTDHHPEWLNLWVNLKVWLTTWDIGFRPTFKDIRLAKYLEALFKEYSRGDERSTEADVVLPVTGNITKD